MLILNPCGNISIDTAIARSCSSRRKDTSSSCRGSHLWSVTIPHVDPSERFQRLTRPESMLVVTQRSLCQYLSLMSVPTAKVRISLMNVSTAKIRIPLKFQRLPHVNLSNRTSSMLIPCGGVNYYMLNTYQC